jgi:zinc protease
MRVILAILLAPCLFAALDDVRTHTLQNGMKIVVQEDHSIPNVAMYFFYRIGSRNERPGATGLSHFFEHMMFNGARKYGPKQFDVQMEKSGGNNNAYTTHDLTVYTDWFPSSALELMFDMESDRIRDLAFDPKIIESERGVVYSERRLSVDNSPFGALHEQALAAAFIAHPYHWPVVGWASDIESWSMDDLKNHFQMGYAPNNCTVVIVGDVTYDQVLTLAGKYFEPIPKHDPPPPVRTKEPEQQGERRVVLNKQAQLPVQMALYHVPDSRDADQPALDVFQTILTRGQSSRLYRRLVDADQIAINVNAQSHPGLDPFVFMFMIQPRSGVDPARTEKALFEEIDKIQSAPVSENELRKAKNQLLAEHYRELKTIAGRANALGNNEIYLGDYSRLFTFEKEIEAVTAADVQRIARKYFTARNRTMATLIPEQQEVKP